MSNEIRTLNSEYIDSNFSPYILNVPNFSKMLRENNAIVAGGSVLSAMKNEPINDIDIYVNLRNAQKVYNYLVNNLIMNIAIFKTHVAPPYDESFLIQNNIIGRFFLYKSLHGDRYTKIDLMIVKDNVTLESVVENFDLSFCKVWYDGTNILTRYLMDILHKKGTLGRNYLEKYISGNWFTIKRVQKYCRKGYDITLPNIDTSSIIIQKKSKKAISGEEWVVYKLIEILSYYTSLSGPYNSSFIILILSILQEYKDSHNKDTLYNIDAFKHIMNTIYQPSLTEFWTGDMLIYVMLARQAHRASRSAPGICYEWPMANICKWNLTETYLSYFNDIGIKLFSSENESAHGFNDFRIPLCSGDVPPFSPGENGFPEDATSRDLKNRIDQGTHILKHIKRNHPDHIENLYYRYFPYLREAAAEIESRREEAVEAAELLQRAKEVEQYLPDGVLPEFATLEQVEIAEEAEVAAQRLMQAERTAQFQQRMPIVRAEQERLERERRERVEAELKRYKEMLDAGVITEEQYQAKSNELLGVPDTETFDINGTDVMPRCFNTYAAGDINTRSWYPDPNHILFLVEFYPGADQEVICTSNEEIDKTLYDENMIQYRCTPKDYVLEPNTVRRIPISDITEGMAYDVSMTDIDETVAYIPFTYGYDGTTAIVGYITEPNMRRILRISQQTDGTRLFNLKFNDTISHTVCKRNTTQGTWGFSDISTNHCQMGSSIMVFDVVDLDTDDPDLVSFNEGSPPPLPPRPFGNISLSNQDSEPTARVLFPEVDEEESNSNDDLDEEIRVARDRLAEATARVAAAVRDEDEVVLEDEEEDDIVSMQDLLTRIAIRERGARARFEDIRIEVQELSDRAEEHSRNLGNTRSRVVADRAEYLVDVAQAEELDAKLDADRAKALNNIDMSENELISYGKERSTEFESHFLRQELDIEDLVGLAAITVFANRGAEFWANLATLDDIDSSISLLATQIAFSATNLAERAANLLNEESQELERAVEAHERYYSEE